MQSVAVIIDFIYGLSIFFSNHVIAEVKVSFQLIEKFGKKKKV